MVEQQKYGKMLMEIIDQTKKEQIQTAEQLIEALVNELKTSNSFS